jgi:peptidoglycan/LPS O-acetylase OafA/YrhL
MQVAPTAWQKSALTMNGRVANSKRAMRSYRRKALLRQTIPEERMKDRFEYLDGLRGLAALVVVFFHSLRAPVGGYFAVDIFFVLSGFLISSQIVSEVNRTGEFSFLNFYKRRVLRLMPAFLVMCAIYLGIRYCFFPHLLPPLGPRRALQALLWTNVNLIVYNYNPMTFFMHLWSISVEWQFYFVWPVILFGMLSIGWRGVRLMLPIAVAVAATELIHAFGLMKVLHIDGLLFGALLAILYKEGRLGLIARHPVVRFALFSLSAMILATLIAICPQDAWADKFEISVASWASMLLILCLISVPKSIIQFPLSHPVPVGLGRISYGLYLIHYPIVCTLQTAGYSPAITTIVTLVVAVALADFSERYIERPIYRLKDVRFFRVKRPNAASEPV